MEIIKIENITWKFNPYSYWDEQDSLGLAYVGIPFPMLKRFIKECAWSDDLKVPPHYYEEDKEKLFCGTSHECYNSDTQIVLMNWLHNKRRKYTLEYRGKDPFWIYHDHCHSQGDVCGYEVSQIYASTEHYRLIEGAEMAKHYGHHIKLETIVELVKAWPDRFRNESQKLHFDDFLPYINTEKEDEELVEYYRYTL